MQKTITFLFSLFLFFGLTGQEIATFEDFDLDPETYLNNADPSGGFDDAGVFFPNSYMLSGGFESWNGWAVSNVTDVTTPGFGNQYSAVTGGGANGSSVYGVSYVFGESSMKNTLLLTNGEATFGSLMITNSTFAYLSMKDGDAIAKKFGGEDGDDPDFLLLTIKGRNGGELTTDSVNFYLADFRFSNNSEDYIVEDWTKVDVSSLNATDELVFTITGSDIGQFGLNTPAYFCADNIVLNIPVSTENLNDKIDLTIFPNPTDEFLTLEWNEGPGSITVFDSQGRIVKNQILNDGQNVLDVSFLPEGIHLLQIRTEEGFVSKKFIKR